MRRHLLTIVCLCSFAIPALAGADLTKIQRRLVKEPVYRTKPKYCLLALGPEARTRLWLVQDGETLYVDRHGNGDLTAPDDKVAAEKRESVDDGYTFKAGDIHDGNLVHKQLIVYVTKLDRMAEIDDTARAFVRKHPGAWGYEVFLEVQMPGWRGTGIGGRLNQRAFYLDANGVLQFAERPAEAPILQFGGPWQISLFGPQKLTIGRDVDVTLGVGSPGVGPGSTTWIDYENIIPADQYPTLDIVYSPRRPGEAPVHGHYELKRRC
jgi:hypothetical protein